MSYSTAIDNDRKFHHIDEGTYNKDDQPCRTVQQANPTEAFDPAASARALEQATINEPRSAKYLSEPEGDRI